MAELAFVEPVDDDVHDIGASTKDLFGDDEEQLEDFNVEVEEEEDTRPTTAPSETLSVEDRRAALQKLVAKQKTGDGLEKKQKKKKRDREEKEGEKPKRSRRDVERKVESQKPSKRGADDEDIPSEELWMRS
ncbi:hypothetical protein CEUSTIGMA_g13402.t1 [Chlamydomonas eustigma]|uniref:Uncharacterized protein n=1 Tax=Chlamydomonas eustigma TaxID=1157962 RepID=A0A250XSH5_9CHLO|nr:hypothetical protein CEUSTIGMA_g13402.t1 [Chlamydomonas eustigma]|eukprot:GAX85986.1 hypothetical protein CEUSTIGMA_g13402.t1 [Chlamydomonas eustigma]